MKRKFFNTQGKQGDLRGYHTWKVGTRRNPSGRIAPFVKVRGFWLQAKCKAIIQFPTSVLFYVSKSS